MSIEVIVRAKPEAVFNCSDAGVLHDVHGLLHSYRHPASIYGAYGVKDNISCTQCRKPFGRTIRFKGDMDKNSRDRNVSSIVFSTSNETYWDI